MKPYFAKWLPIEGKVKIGDCYVDTLAKIPGTVYRLYLEGIDFPLREMKRVKLFLCSRDIQVGDKARTQKFPEVEYEVTSIVDALNNEISIAWGFPAEGKIVYSALLNETFKVIGPISSGARWVKDNDEFELTDLQMLLEGNHNPWPFDPTFPFDGEHKLKHILIKCLCCGDFK